MSLTRLALGALLLHAAAPAPPAALFRRSPSGSQRGPAISLRKRVHVNTLITEPDTIDVQWGGAFSSNGSFTFPTSVSYTPQGSHIYWGRTEFSAGFDSLNSSLQSFNRTTQFGDRATLAAICVIHDGDKLDLAFAPSASFLLRGDSGARLGATAIARYDAGRSSAGVTFTWTGATTSSNTNPAGIFDVGAGYGFRLKPSGPLGHLTPHVNAQYEKATRVNRQISLFEGVEYQVTGPLAIDFSAQQLSLWGGATDHQFVVGLTVNTGHLHHR
jgi:hypothetical protein